MDKQDDFRTLDNIENLLIEAEDEINWSVYTEVIKLMPIPESEG